MGRKVITGKLSVRHSSALPSLMGRATGKVAGTSSPTQACTTEIPTTKLIKEAAAIRLHRCHERPSCRMCQIRAKGWTTNHTRWLLQLHHGRQLPTYDEWSPPHRDLRSLGDIEDPNHQMMDMRACEREDCMNPCYGQNQYGACYKCTTYMMDNEGARHEVCDLCELGQESTPYSG